MGARRHGICLRVFNVIPCNHKSFHLRKYHVVKISCCLVLSGHVLRRHGIKSDDAPSMGLRFN